MADCYQDCIEGEVERLREALETETQQKIDVQRKLDRTSAEYEEFVLTAAHNLREPLREVASFSQLMVETYAGRLDSDAGLYLERIEKAAATMQSVLADIVDYWATGTGDPPSARTDMEAAFSQALLSADEQITERAAIVTHDPLPAVTGDFEILSKVLYHLIGNAIEYCVEASPRVHISSRRLDLEWIFSVQDNGPGIAPEFQGRVFRVFKRLHGKEHPGNGLGLAFCKKVVEWQGGRMWLESTPGSGSTFYFTVAPAD